MTEDADALLKAFISPITIEDFRKQFWPDEVFVIHGPLERLPAPFTNPELLDFKELFSRYSGRILFSKGSRSLRSVLVQNVDPLQLYKMGLSLYLPDIEPIVSGASMFLRELERSLGLNEGDARITAWASPTADGIPCHLDAEEVFSIQLQGIKRFYVAENKAITSPVGFQFGPGIPASSDLYYQSDDGFPDPKNFEFTEIEMKPGSVLFMPRGVWHKTEVDQDSLSVSVILSPSSAADRLLQEMRSLLLQDPRWRRPIYHSLNSLDYSDSGSYDLINRLLKNLPDIVKIISPEDLGPKNEFKRLENIKPDMRFQKIPHAQILLDTNAVGPVLRIKTNRVENGLVNSLEPGIDVPDYYVPVVQWLESREAAFSVKELMEKFSSVPLSDHQGALGFLARQGFLKLLWFQRLDIKE